MPKKVDKIEEFSGKYRFLSNFLEGCPFVYDGILHKTSEHAFQAAKTLDPMWHAKITTAIGPGQAKMFGRKAPIRSDWDSIRIGVMLDILRAKFKDPTLKRMLLETGDAELIEGNYWNDHFWGVCDGRGENHLGKLLMQIREEFQKDSSGPP